MGQAEQASTPINLDALRLIRQGFAEAGLTQEALSKASGIPRSTLANVLSPTARPRLIHVNQLISLAIALGVDPRDWVAELEDLERRRRDEQGGDLARRRARSRPAPRVQKRAARSTSGRRTPADE